MFGLRQVLRASLCYPQKSVKYSNFQNHWTSKNSEILRRLTTTANDDVKTEKTPEITKHPMARIKAQMRVEFTCKKCDTRNSKTMSKLAYEKGVVIIRCDGCKNNHLIADNLGWFGGDPRKRNIEKIMKLHGEKVKRITVYGSDIMEFMNKEEAVQIVSEKVEEIDIETPDINR